MRVVWTDEAIAELEGIIDYIAADNPPAAYDLADEIITWSDAQLTENPMSGRPGRVADTRELIVHGSYIVVYRVGRETVQILTVRHGARLWPKSL